MNYKDMELNGLGDSEVEGHMWLDMVRDLGY